LKRYLKENIIDKKSGEVKKDHQKHISVDWEKYNREQKWTDIIQLLLTIENQHQNK
jgi:hypothetical protein